MINSAKQSMAKEKMDCFVASASRNDGWGLLSSAGATFLVIASAAKQSTAEERMDCSVAVAHVEEDARKRAYGSSQ
jgi:hypothetical protein